MSDYNIASSNMSTNTNEAVADQLYRIHCYANTLAKLCHSGGSDNAINPEQLQQIFKDIADVTDSGAAALYSASENLKPLKDIACDLALDSETNPDPLFTPFIKRHNIMGKKERIYVPEYVDTNGLTPTEILMQGVILEDKYHLYTVKDFKLWMQTKDSFKEVYFLVPLHEPRLQHECENDYYKRVGIRIVRECVQD